MDKIKIGIIGKGSSSAIAFSTLIEYIQKVFQPKQEEFTNGFEFVCIHDPDVPIFPVGEGLSPKLRRTLELVLDYKYDVNNTLFDETPRRGTKHFWTKSIGKDFDISYRPNIGLHVNAAKFSNSIFEKLKQKYTNFYEIHDVVSEISQTEDKVILICEKNTYDNFDFIFDCRGFPEEETLKNGEYDFPKFEFVNTVLLYQDFKVYDEPYTTNYVHENGWMFGIPLTHRKAFGYLYNKSITNYDDALINFKQTLKHYVDLDAIDEDRIKKISWNQYYKKKIMDGRVLSIGARLYFFDPHHGMPLHYISMCCRFFIGGLLGFTNGHFNLKNYNLVMNNFHKISINKLKDLIAINYVNSGIDSEFWKTATQNGKSIIKESNVFFNWYADRNFHLCENGNNLEGFNIPYSPHEADLMNQYLTGYNIDLDGVYYD